MLHICSSAGYGFGHAGSRAFSIRECAANDAATQFGVNQALQRGAATHSGKALRCNQFPVGGVDWLIFVRGSTFTLTRLENIPRNWWVWAIDKTIVFAADATAQVPAQGIMVFLDVVDQPVNTRRDSRPLLFKWTPEYSTLSFQCRFYRVEFLKQLVARRAESFFEFFLNFSRSKLQ